MPWNWELPDWPDFGYDSARIAAAEVRFLQNSSLLLGVMIHLNPADSAALRVELLSEEALETSRIEGEILNRESVQSSIAREFGLPTPRRKIGSAEDGVSRVLADVYRNFDQQLTLETLCHWQALFMQGHSSAEDIGKLRTSAEPMEIVSGSMHRRRVHFEAVAARRLPAEMERFLFWFNTSRNTLPALARAAIGHAYFESIHPFADGNGRVGRALVEMTLAQGSGKPALLALSKTIQSRKKEYYQQLGRINESLEISDWVAFFAEIILDSQRLAGISLQWTLEKTRWMSQLRDQLNPRQEKALNRLFTAGPNGFHGGFSAGNYQSLAKTSPATATRDLAELVNWGVLSRHGQRRHTRYALVVNHEPLL